MLFAMIITMISCGSVLCSPSEERLLSFLFDKYNTRVRPTLNDEETVNVTLNIKIFQLLAVNEKQQNIEMSIWLRQSWKDPVSHVSNIWKLQV